MWRILFVMMLVALPAGFVTGCKYEQGQVAQASVRAGLKTLKTVHASGQATTSAAVERQAAHDRFVYQTRTLVKEVPVAIPPASDVVLPAGFVWLHNQAVSAPVTADLSGLSSAPAGLDVTPSGVTASDAAPVVLGNYGTCRDTADELVRLQDWVSAQQAIYAGNAPPASPQ